MHISSNVTYVHTYLCIYVHISNTYVLQHCNLSIGMNYPYIQDCIPQGDCPQVNNPLVISGTHSGKSVTVTLTSSRTDLSQRSEPILGNMCLMVKQEYLKYSYSYTVDACALVNVIVYRK